MTIEMVNQRLIGNLVRLFNMYELWEMSEDLKTTKKLFEQTGLWDWKHKAGVITTMLKEKEFAAQLMVGLDRMRGRLAASDAYQAAGYKDTESGGGGLPLGYIGRIMLGKDVPANPDDYEAFIDELIETGKETAPDGSNKIYEETSFRLDPEVILQESVELIKNRERLRTEFEDAARTIREASAEGDDTGMVRTTAEKRKISAKKAALKKTVDIWNQAQSDLEIAEQALGSKTWLDYLAGLVIDVLEEATSDMIGKKLPEHGIMMRYACLEQYGRMQDVTEAINTVIDTEVKKYASDNPAAPMTIALAQAAKRATITLSLFPPDDGIAGSLWGKTDEYGRRRRHKKLYREVSTFYGSPVCLSVIQKPVVMLTVTP